MPIYRLRNHTSDTVPGAVKVMIVRARTGREARNLAAEHVGEEYPSTWTDASLHDATVIEWDGEPTVLAREMVEGRPYAEWDGEGCPHCGAEAP